MKDHSAQYIIALTDFPKQFSKAASKLSLSPFTFHYPLLATIEKFIGLSNSRGDRN